MAAHPHLSIGEVLSLLQDEFPDVTISKIRFLESQGLVDPERTPSGYRKFYDGDIERLRWVLRQQRDAFLPLKVIKGRLEEQGAFPGDDEEFHEATSAGLGGAAPEVEEHGAAGQEALPAVERAVVGAGGRDRGRQVEARDEGRALPALVPAALSTGREVPGGGAKDPALAPAGNGQDEAGAVGGRPYATPQGRRAAAAPARSGGGEQVANAAQLFDAGPPYSAYGVGGSSGPASTRDVVGAAQPERRPPPERRVPSAWPPVASSATPAEPAPAGRDAPAAHAVPAAPATPEAPGAMAVSGAPGSAVGRGGRQGHKGATAAGPRPDRPEDAARRGRPLEVGAVPADDELALEELVSAAEVDIATVRDLERYGLISPRVVGGATYYTHEAAVIARLASAFARHGVEARHLRAYKGAAEREAGMVQQVIMPLIRQRNPEARLAAAQAVEELSNLGGELRAALLRSALADLR